MPRPVPTAADIAERSAARLETDLTSARPSVEPLAISRAVRSARGVLSMIVRAIALELRAVHDHLSWWGRMYFPDTAEDEFVLRHASIWGVLRRPSTHALGSVTIEGIAGRIIAAQTRLVSGDGLAFDTLDVATIEANGEVEVPVRAVRSGVESNLPAGTGLATQIPNPDLSRIRVGAEGFAGGFDQESIDSLRRRTLAHIRQRPHGGASFDYQRWLENEYATRTVKVLPDWVGRGSVGVAPVMKVDGYVYGRPATPDELQAMAVTLGRPSTNEGVRPVTAHIVMIETVAQALPLTVRLRPDTVAARLAVTEAWERFVATIGDDADVFNDSPVGATIEPSRISEAISAANGEYAHDLIVPAGPFTLAPTHFPTPADPVFEDAV
ncbi:MAG: baseplate J/gp47 family protein [Ahrensia sp.]|nr:baseplate J/gp47 family protein [Ahrensia sp.]